MPFVKLICKRKIYKKKKGAILLIEDQEVRPGFVRDDEGNEYFSEDVAPLTEEEKARCLKEEIIEL